MKENQKLIVKIMVAVSLIVTIILCAKFWHKHEVKNGIDTYGTYIMAAICKNGIVVGSDSRSVFVDSKNNVVAYFENSRLRTLCMPRLRYCWLVSQLLPTRIM